MNLRNKKTLASNALKVGKGRVSFVKARIDEIKEAISKQDIKDLKEGGAIIVRPIKGRRKNVPRNNKRGVGKIKKKVNNRKQEYVKITRKLRAYVLELKKQGKLDSKKAKKIRKKIRNRDFKSKANLKIYVEGMKK